MTYRERREAKADRLRGWAEKRTAKAEAGYKAREPYVGDIAFWTQPGNIPERTRLYRTMERAFENSTKAQAMSRRAAGIEAAADRAIYSDDPDAIARLQERIAELEAKRSAMNAANTAYRKEHRAELKAMTAFGRSQNIPYPSYAITNIGGNITRQRQRLTSLESKAQS